MTHQLISADFLGITLKTNHFNSFSRNIMTKVGMCSLKLIVVMNTLEKHLTGIILVVPNLQTVLLVYT